GGPRQHLQMVPLRAVENRTAIVRAANTGVSAIVLPSGEIQSVLPLGTRGTLRGDVPLRRGETFYTRFGDVFAYACAAMSAGALLAGLPPGRPAVGPGLGDSAPASPTSRGRPAATRGHLS